ncbi:hypothetical protein SAMN05192566_1533 [Methylophilus rhizosphaerae]|uniref:Uncharacterized protein n=1 Tax=Methylophilus rhizosphaerae TaxID=492660 RepID=A0A1G9CM98_9PROT|nr:hypothetical protein [Methylophilus rhizosphaerae]SDK52823.1 hypothetical protein SAMN05192566_1533 [Methylophilus rhizosphaerae]
MNQKTRSLIAFALFVWATTSMYLVWFTKYEMIGGFGFLVMAALNIYYKKHSVGSAV